jgi:hypothetical protein
MVRSEIARYSRWPLASRSCDVIGRELTPRQEFGLIAMRATGMHLGACGVALLERAAERAQGA